MTFEQAQQLIELPKFIIESDTKLEKSVINLPIKAKERIFLFSEVDRDISLFVEIYQSTKNTLKITLHLQDDIVDFGLLRIDYNGSRHKNPEVANDQVPKHFLPFTGKWLDGNHIHYVIEGYPSLAWAIPLKVDPYPLKTITTTTEISEAISVFFSKINVQTKLRFNIQTDAFL